VPVPVVVVVVVVVVVAVLCDVAVDDVDVCPALEEPLLVDVLPVGAGWPLAVLVPPDRDPPVLEAGDDALVVPAGTIGWGSSPLAFSWASI
jgi:hypothetical protein